MRWNLIKYSIVHSNRESNESYKMLMKEKEGKVLVGLGFIDEIGKGDS